MVRLEWHRHYPLRVNLQALPTLLNTAVVVTVEPFVPNPQASVFPGHHQWNLRTVRQMDRPFIFRYRLRPLTEIRRLDPIPMRFMEPFLIR